MSKRTVMAQNNHTSAGCVVFIDDDKYIRESTEQLMEIEGIDVTCFSSAVTALDHIDRDCCSIIISDIKMPKMSGLELLQQVQQIDADIPVILITGHGDIAMAVNAIQNGAYDFIEKPFSNDVIIEVTHRALEKRLLTLENRNLKLELSLQNTPGQRIIGRASSVQQLRSTIARLASTDADVLLMGETGTGKDLVARNLHESGQRCRHNFVAINCGAIPESIIESELFGHDAGAFTGAENKRIGKFEYGEGGTIFLDEIESMPLQLQVKLLRILQERIVEPLGSNRQIPLDVRVIAATKADLRKEIQDGRFREDLYYRLNVLTLKLPSLRDRMEDLPLLFQHFVLLASLRHGCETPHISPERMQELLSHQWPGNVRELKNVAERFVLLDRHAPLISDKAVDPRDNSDSISLHTQVEWFEKNLIEQVLIRTHGSINATMKHLGTARKTLYDKMRKYRLDKSDYK